MYIQGAFKYAVYVAQDFTILWNQGQKKAGQAQTKRVSKQV
ncbi:hypothetical protein MGWOODY_Clf129 [hydrothermal vent metagenome]|uniref:Uncharacterized protein n=1 Tax=hydrothermal vent metagenome TaxID=652676 RepID=A0A170QBD0_9ZZZZ